MSTKAKDFLLWAMLWAGPLVGSVGADPLGLQTPGFQAVGDLSWSLGSQAGYETQGIPDWSVSHDASTDLKQLLHLGIGVDWGGLLPDHTLRVYQLRGLASVALIQSEDLQVQLYGRGFYSPGPEVSRDYTGAMVEITKVLSARADGSSGGGGGVYWAVPLPLSGLSMAASAEGLYGFQAPSDLPLKSGWRIQTDVVPTYRLPMVSDMWFQLQNRGQYWLDRGWGYEVLPQLSWTLTREWTVAAGCGIQVVGPPGWRAVAGFRWTPQTNLADAVHSLTSSIDSVYTSFQVIPEGKNIRIRIYFTFEGDKADLFEPQNARYGLKNQELMTQLLGVIRKYPGAQILVEGHTNRSKLNQPYEQEQKNEMLPLAKARALAVADALALAKIDKKTVKTAAIGGDRPLAPFTDPANNWKNRRVEILLIRE